MCSRTGCQPSKDSPPVEHRVVTTLRRKARCSGPATARAARASPRGWAARTPRRDHTPSRRRSRAHPSRAHPSRAHPSRARRPRPRRPRPPSLAKRLPRTARPVPRRPRPWCRPQRSADPAFEIGDDLVGAALGTAFRVDCRVAACVVRSALVSVEAEHLRAAPDARENREEQPEARPHHHAPCHASPARSAATYGTTCVLAALGEGTRRISHTPAAIPAAPAANPTVAIVAAVLASPMLANPCALHGDPGTAGPRRSST